MEMGTEKLHSLCGSGTKAGKTENKARACGVSCQRRHHNDTESVELQMRKQCNNNNNNHGGKNAKWENA